ncbi:MAG: hypothetical protein RLZZ127_600 [Planctomycetota bacterium]|jgi:tetratricopeptide (TPR) repeat protein
MIPPGPALPADLVALLGDGSEHRIHRARQHGLDREVALKLPVVAGEGASLAREAVAAAAVEHPGALVVHGLGDGWLMTQLVEGATLAALLARPGDPGRLATAVEALAAVADTLAAAHALGVVHGEVLAEHILLGRFGEVVLLDWGRALRLPHGPAALPGPDAADPERIAPAARAPELTARDRAAIGAATDIWQLGRVLDAVLAGEAVPPPPLVALAAASAAEPAARPTAVAVAATLRQWLAGSAGAAHAAMLLAAADRRAGGIPADPAPALAAWQQVEQLLRTARLHDPDAAVDARLVRARAARLRLALAAGDAAHARRAARDLGPDLEPGDAAAVAHLVAATARRTRLRGLARRGAVAAAAVALLALTAWPLLRWQEIEARDRLRRGDAARLAAAALVPGLDPTVALEQAVVAAGLDPDGPGSAAAARLAAGQAAAAVAAGHPGAAAEALAIARRFGIGRHDPALAASLAAGPDQPGSVAWAGGAATRAVLARIRERVASIDGWLAAARLDGAVAAAATARWSAWSAADQHEAAALRHGWRRALLGDGSRAAVAAAVAAAAHRRGERTYPLDDLLPLLARGDAAESVAAAFATAGADHLYERAMTALAAGRTWSTASAAIADWVERHERPVATAARSGGGRDAAHRRRLEIALWRLRAVGRGHAYHELAAVGEEDPARAAVMAAFAAVARAQFHNDWPAARTAAQRLVDLEPGREASWADLVLACTRSGAAADGWERAQTALARFPEPGPVLLIHAAIAARDAGASASAAALTDAARHAVARTALSDTRAQDAFASLVASLPGGADEAVQAAYRNRAANPDDGWQTFNLIEALTDAGRFAEAVRVADEGLARWPDFHFIIAGRAEALARLGRLDEALADAERAVSIYPRNPGILRFQARILDRAGRTEHALCRMMMGLALKNSWPVQDEILTMARRLGPRADGDALGAARAVLADKDFGPLPRSFAGLAVVRIACERDQAWAALPAIRALAALPARSDSASAALAILAVGIPAWQRPGAAPVPDLDVAWALADDATAILAASSTRSATVAAQVEARCAAAAELAGDHAMIAPRLAACRAILADDATAAAAALLAAGGDAEPALAAVRARLLDPAAPLLPLPYDTWDGWRIRRPVPELGFDAAAVAELGALLAARGATAALPAPSPRWKRMSEKELPGRLGRVNQGWDFPPASWKARQAALAAAKASATAAPAK